MLTLTADAVAAIRDLTSQPETPPETGLRIALSSQDGPARALELSISGGPLGDDQVLEAEDVHVYLEPAAAYLLGDKTLDVETTPDDRLRFRIIEAGI